MRKFLPYILIVVMVAVFALGPFGAGEAHAGFLFDIGSFAAGAGNLVLKASSAVLGISGYFFDAAIEYAITDKDASTNQVIKEGWTLSRDVANLFFIFILLYIAIATILQLSGYGLKDLLVTVIIIALLVNFSLVFTKMIIDASNVLAVEFHTVLNNIEDKAGVKVGLSAAIVSGINPQQLFDESAIFETKIRDKETGKVTGTKMRSKEGTLTQIFIITVMGSALILVTAFVLFAAGVLFTIRTVVLWLLMIISPLAFLAMVLPATKSYASKWWSVLFSQAFFAPAYLFMFYFAVKITAEGSIISEVNKSNLAQALGDPGNQNVKLILNFVLVMILMIAALIIAKQMGAYGAGTMQKWGQSARKWGQGYAGNIGKRYAAPMAKGLVEGEGTFAKTLRKVPLVSRGLARASVLDQPEISKYKKQYSSYSPKTLASFKASSILNRSQREAIEKVEAENERKQQRKKILGDPKASSIDKMRELAEMAEEEREFAEAALKGVREKSEETASKGAGENT